MNNIKTSINKGCYALALFLAMVSVSGAYGQHYASKYPYIDHMDDRVFGPIVVSRDAKGGAKAGAIGTPDGTHTFNKVSPKFQIYSQDLTVEPGWDYDDIDQACKREAGFSWRVPTQRELMLIWVMGGAPLSRYGMGAETGMGTSTQLADKAIASYFGWSAATLPFETLNGDYYWSATAAGTNTAWSTSMINGSTERLDKSETASIRCVRDYPVNAEAGYTEDVANSIILIYPDDYFSRTSSWMSNMYDVVCPDGYELPTQYESVLMYIYKDSFIGHNFETEEYQFYWSTTPHTKNSYWAVLVGDGFLAGQGTGRGRCIRKNPASGNKYPYVDGSDIANGPIIVSADANGGVSAAALGTTDGTQLFNKVAPKLQVANADLPNRYEWDYDNLKDACESELGTGWRTPTQREMMLIMAMGGAAADQYGVDFVDKVTCGTGEHIAGDTPLHSFNEYTPLLSDPYSSSTKLYSCYWTATFLEGIYNNPIYLLNEPVRNNGQFWTAATTTKSLVRCVRDK